MNRNLAGFSDALAIFDNIMRTFNAQGCKF